LTKLRLYFFQPNFNPSVFQLKTHKNNENFAHSLEKRLQNRCFNTQRRMHVGRRSGKGIENDVSGWEFSGYCGFVTAFEVDADYASKFDVQNVGGFEHNELWVPAEELTEFNQHIVGKIEVLAAFYGKKYIGETPLSR
jgi:hypothetical protein